MVCTFPQRAAAREGSREQRRKTLQSCLATAAATETAARLHADRTTHPSIVLVARPTVCRAGYYVRACGNAYVARYW